MWKSATTIAGPHTIDEIHKIYAGLRKRFPTAEVKAANLTDIANAIEPYRQRLPVVTQEIGDTWIYGVASEPLKVARYREVARLRNSGSRTENSTRAMPPISHSWAVFFWRWSIPGARTPRPGWISITTRRTIWRPCWMSRSTKSCSPVGSKSGRTWWMRLLRCPPPCAPRPPSACAIFSPPSLPPPACVSIPPPIRSKRNTSPLRSIPKQERFAACTAKRPGTIGPPHVNRWLCFPIRRSPKGDYDRFFAAYLKSQADWAPKDFGKPNIERFGAQSRTWLPAITECRQSSNASGHTILAQLKINDGEAEKAGRTAWPEKMYLELMLPDAEPVVEVRFSWFGKAANRMPEALWLSFQPAASDPRSWLLDKSGSSISPFDVVTGGNRAMHAVLGGLHYKGPEGALNIETLDAPLVALGERLPVHFSRNQPGLANGFHFSLFNNGWGTNYVQWFGEDMRFRFRISA